ncbi:hypothetical protein SAMN03159341_1141 [Paenibacillus sp. 1_12]|uniref:hypothetical protein n=1 Tax=Paenibacillus sp. 1_12 TaxID=1566278 RepID=UPI0008EE7031|nr:hypothetical protein [Paenibacillus sp. 1_12]SFM01269.1 hypothetical protein SAMN03159341_1141 [Paenibacillus sp. 1_12]
MNTAKTIAACALTALLLSGCGTNTAAPSASNSASAAPAGDQSKQQTGAPRTIDPNQRTMMMTFQSLIMMDKSSGLEITKDQAVKMLPVVQEAVTKSELSTDAQTNLLASLTADQKKFIEEAEAKNKQRASGQGGQRPQGDQTGNKADGSKSGGQGTPSGGQPEGQAGQGGGQRQQGDGANKGGTKPTNGQSGQGGQRPQGGQGQGGNIGQQLVELLQAKTK